MITEPKEGMFVATVLPNHRYLKPGQKALVYNTSHGDVLLCKLVNGFTFPIHIRDVYETTTWEEAKKPAAAVKPTIVAEAPAPTAPAPAAVAAPKKHSNTIKKKAPTSRQQSLF